MNKSIWVRHSSIEFSRTNGKARPFRTERGRAHLPDPELISVVSGLYLSGIQGEVKNGNQGEIKRGIYELLILA
jgi:hypothetical protein